MFLSYGHNVTSPSVRPLSSKNQYDIRKECEESNNGLCYKAFDYIESWINREDVKTALGVNLTLHATDCTLSIQQDFKRQAQAVADSVAYIPELVNGGVRLLAFAGDAGEYPAVLLICYNTEGNGRRGMQLYCRLIPHKRLCPH